MVQSRLARSDMQPAAAGLAGAYGFAILRRGSAAFARTAGGFRVRHARLRHLDLLCGSLRALDLFLGIRRRHHAPGDGRAGDRFGTRDRGATSTDYAAASRPLWLDRRRPSLTILESQMKI